MNPLFSMLGAVVVVIAMLWWFDRSHDPKD
jgi:hypothetical protein